MNVQGTGLQGFIGKHLVGRLERRGDIVTDIPYQTISHHHPGAFDVFLFLSSYGNHSYQRGDGKMFKANVTDLWAMLNKTLNIDYKAFIHFSTSSVLLEHQTMYSATKAAAEDLVKGFAQSHGKPVVSIRPLSVYGEGEADHRFIPTVIRNIINREVVKLGDGSHDWIWVDDLVEGVLAVVDNIAEIKEPVNIGTGKQTSNKDIYQKLVDLLDIPATKVDVGRMREYDTNYWQFDISGISKFGWSAKVNMDEGLRRCVEYYAKRYRENHS